MNRRHFLRLTGAAIAASAGLNACAPPRVRTRSDGRPLANATRRADQPIRVACIGVGGRGLESMNEMLAECVGGARPEFIVIAAVCDVDELALERAAMTHSTARSFRDYRQLFREIHDGSIEVDAVMVSTPDHTHALATALALTAGLPVYCEKPLTHTIAQARAIAQLAQRSQVPTQMGNQIHAGDNYRTVAELIRSGAIGTVTSADGWDGRAWCCGALTPGARAPETLDWNLWQGPVAATNYIEGITPANWRGYWNYGNGTLGDMACHILDLPFWALDLSAHENLVAEVHASGPPVDAVGCPAWTEISWAMKSARSVPGSDPLVFRWFDGGKISPTAQELSAKDGQEYVKRFNMLIQGSKGFLFSNYGEYVILPRALGAEIQRPSPTLSRPSGHHREWIDAVRLWTMDAPDACAMTSSNFAYAARLTELVLSGATAFRAQTPVTYDFDRGLFVGAGTSEAMPFLSEPARDGWQLPALRNG